MQVKPVDISQTFSGNSNITSCHYYPDHVLKFNVLLSYSDGLGFRVWLSLLRIIRHYLHVFEKIKLLEA